MRNLMFFLLLIACFFSCSNNNGGNSEEEKDNLVNRDSLLKEKRLLVNDSINQLNDTLFAGYRFGMSEREFDLAKNKFYEEVGGNMKICNLDFGIGTPSFKHNKLENLELSHTDYYNATDKYLLEYFGDLKERYITRLGMPDLFLDKDFTPCDSSSNNLCKIVWIFNTRVIEISKDKNLNYDRRIKKSYYISFMSREVWDNLFSLVQEAQRVKSEYQKNVEKNRKEYSDEI